MAWTGNEKAFSVLEFAGLTSAASPRVDISSTCKVGEKLGVSLPLLTCSPSAWPFRLLYCRGRKSRRDLWITLYSSSFKETTYGSGRAVAQGFSRPRVRIQASPLAICGQSCTGAGLPPSTSAFTWRYHPTKAPYSITYHWRHVNHIRTDKRRRLIVNFNVTRQNGAKKNTTSNGYRTSKLVKSSSPAFSNNPLPLNTYKNQLYLV